MIHFKEILSHVLKCLQGLGFLVLSSFEVQTGSEFNSWVNGLQVRLEWNTLSTHSISNWGLLGLLTLLVASDVDWLASLSAEII